MSEIPIPGGRKVNIPGLPDPPSSVNVHFDAFARLTIMRIAGAVGVPYELAMKDYRREKGHPPRGDSDDED